MGRYHPGACFISNVIRFAANFFVHFAGFEDEYSKYLTEKRVKWTEKGDVKMVTGLVKQAPIAPKCRSGGIRHTH